MSKRESSSVILQNLKKRDLSQLGHPVVPISEAERLISGAEASGSAAAMVSEAEDVDSAPDSNPDSYQPSVRAVTEAIPAGTRLRPKERAARSALIVRLDPQLHRELDEVARYNRLTMNDIVTEAIQMHLQNFAHPPDYNARKPG
jgi:hypothetical protein